MSHDGDIGWIHQKVDTGVIGKREDASNQSSCGYTVSTPPLSCREPSGRQECIVPCWSHMDRILLSTASWLSPCPPLYHLVAGLLSCGVWADSDDSSSTEAPCLRKEMECYFSILVERNSASHDRRTMKSCMSTSSVASFSLLDFDSILWMSEALIGEHIAPYVSQCKWSLSVEHRAPLIWASVCGPYL